MQVDVLNSKGEKTGRSVELPDDIFGIEPNDHCIYLAVKQYLAAQRQGTHKTKTRAEGNIRNPLYKGGGTVNGPLPHGYDFKLNRKVKDLAKMSALSHKAKASKIVIVEDLNYSAPKTKDFAAMLGKLNGTQKSLFIMPEYETTTFLSARNIGRNKTVVLSDMNTYDLVNAQVLVFTETAAKMFNEAVEA
jgi:large subunit ribosomal protein L4